MVFFQQIKLKFLGTLLLLLAVFLLFPKNAAADTSYGEGDYGSGNYGGAQSGPTSTPNNNSGSSGGSSGGGGGSAAPSGCSSASPTASPNLFQIDAKNVSARVYFAPAGSNISSYYISFGQGNLDEGYGGSLDINPKGAGAYDVTFLKPSTTYTFKIRASNGCASGPWSNTLRIKTTASAKATTKYYPKTQAAGSIFNTLSGLSTYVSSKVSGKQQSASLEPPSKVASLAPPSKQKAPAAVSKPAVKKSSPSLFQRIINFFGF